MITATLAGSNSGLVGQAATVARLEGAWQGQEADAAQLGGADDNGDAEQQPHGTGMGALDRKARTPATLGQPARKRSRLQTQATWNSARVLCASVPSRPQYHADQSSGLDTSTAEPACTMNAVVCRTHLLIGVDQLRLLRLSAILET